MRTLPRAVRAIFAVLVLTIAFSTGQTVLAQTVGSGDVLISEFRLSGPGGFADEYIEFYCNRDTACDISGYRVAAYDPDFGNFSIGFPAGVVIPSREHLLLGDNFGYSLANYADLDFNASGGGDFDFFIDNQGFRLTNANQSVVIDSVGFIGGGGAAENPPVTYIEGAGLQQATSRPADQYAYVRKLASGRPQDTNNNAADFTLVSVTGTAQPGITQSPTLGAPGPENSISPVQLNATIKASLIAPATGSSAPPNRVRTGSATGTNAAFGTLTIRRRFTNLTGRNITFLGFRIVDITVLNSPGDTSGTQADVRLLDSGSTSVTVNGNPVTVQGTSLEQPPAQPNGGGLNSSAGRSSVAGTITNAAIAPGGTADVQFVLGVRREGNFRFLVNIEALTSAPNSTPLPNDAKVKSILGKGAAVKEDRATPALLTHPKMMSERRAWQPSGQLMKQR